MEYNIMIYFLLFLIYSIIGWIMEVVVSAIDKRKFVNRGFLIGPYCPIYGTGGILITLLLERYIDEPITLFIMAILVCGILEYLTSYFMEKIFKARWWDYTNKRFNINGRICLETVIPFGLLGCFIMYVLNPFILGRLSLIPNFALHIVFAISFIGFCIDNIISFKIIYNVRNISQKIHLDFHMDSTEEISKKVREILKDTSSLSKRLVEAFPKISAIKNIKRK